jgi:hypothetical protein
LKHLFAAGVAGLFSRPGLKGQAILFDLDGRFDGLQGLWIELHVISPCSGGLYLSAHDAHVEGALLFAIHTQQGIGFVVVQGRDVARAEPQRNRCQGQVLGNVTGVEVDVAI